MSTVRSLSPLLLAALLSACATTRPPALPSAPPTTSPKPPSPKPPGLGGTQDGAVTLSFIDGMDFGSGYDSTTGTFLGGNSCLEISDRPTIASPSNMKNTFNLTEIESKANLADALDVSASASYDAGVTKVSGTASFAQSQDINSYNVGELLTVDVTGQNYTQYTTTKNAHLTPSALDLYKHDYAAFRRSCGDHFLNTLTLGGQYLAYFNFTTYSADNKSKIAAKLKGSFGAVTVAAEFSKTMHSLASTSTLNIRTYETGVSSTPGVTLDTLITEAQSYQSRLTDACSTVEGLKKCVNSAQFVPYSNYVQDAPDTTQEDAINNGSDELDTLVVRGNMVNDLIGSGKVIHLNPSLYDAAAVAATRQAIIDADTWKLAINAAITACNQKITLCEPKSVDPKGAEAKAEAAYGPLPTYAELNKAIRALPDITAKLPANCTDQQKIYLKTTDDDYTVFIDQDVAKSYKLYCQNMAAGHTPAEYLTLGTENNTQSVKDYTDSAYRTLSGRQTTTFSKIKIDPATLIVDPKDVTWTTNTNSLVESGTPELNPSLPLGTVIQSARPHFDSPMATATIDLRFTPLIFDTDATTFLLGPDGASATPSDDKKKYTITPGRLLEDYNKAMTTPSQIRLQLPAN